jgi:small subunit ribosomal protein S17e
MGRVRNKTVKKAAKALIEKYYMKLTPDFHLNKKVLSDVGEIPSKKIRNRIAGFATHLLKRIQTGPVKGISLKVPPHHPTLGARRGERAPT